MAEKILELKNVVKSFEKENGQSITILDNINITCSEGEIIGIIGRSGCGKSTALRLITGLIPVSSGEILFHGKQVTNTDSKMSMVFQTFGLFPWLTVWENIALGLKTKNMTEEYIQEKVENAIGLVGLAGFEEAYPREISGGMRQRVGFARSLIGSPEVLVLDDPFSALDYLTASILKSDLLDLWLEHSGVSSIKLILLVTHSVEEAVSLCDRVVVLSSNPGRIIDDIKINIAHPRDPESPAFHNTIDKIYAAMTSQAVHLQNINKKMPSILMEYPQNISFLHLYAFIDLIKDKKYKKGAGIRQLAKGLILNYTEVGIIIETLILLKFITINENNMVFLTSAGNIFHEADDLARKNILKTHMVKYVPFINKIYHELQKSENISIKIKDLSKMLSNELSSKQIHTIIDNTIKWIRFTELCSCDENRTLSSPPSTFINS
jgi:NitT/TauT family transport system ATP-binding protein